MKRNPIIAALDVPTAFEAITLAQKLQLFVGGFKIGSELFTAACPQVITAVKEFGLVFLDLKFHDIPNTTAKAVASAIRLGVGMLNVHTSGGVEMMKAAQQSALQMSQPARSRTAAGPRSHGAYKHGHSRTESNWRFWNNRRASGMVG